MSVELNTSQQQEQIQQCSIQHKSTQQLQQWNKVFEESKLTMSMSMFDKINCLFVYKRQGAEISKETTRKFH
jgi:hypothetical protein